MNDTKYVLSVLSRNNREIRQNFRTISDNQRDIISALAKIERKLNIK